MSDTAPAPRPPRRRAVVVTRLFSPEVSAASARLRALTVAFAEAGWDVEVLTTRPPTGTADVADPDGVRVRRWPVLRDAQQTVRGYVQYLSFDLPLVLRLLVVRRPDVVICEPPPTTGLVVRVVCALRRVPYVWFAADVWSDGAASAGAPGPVVRAVRAVESWVLSGARHVLSVNEGVTERLLLLGVRPETVQLVGNGVDTDVFGPDDVPEGGSQVRGAPIPEPYAAYAGTMSEWQGADVFVRGFAQVLDRLPRDARLVFLGQGSALPSIRAAADELAPGRVDFPGVVPPPVAARWQRHATCALVSIVPGQGYDFARPTKIWAATATGTPVLYAGVGAAAEQVEREALGEAVDHDASAVAEGLVRAFAAPPSDERRARLADWTREHASLRQVAREAVAGVLRAIGLPG
ncbi:glycosyltransferase [Angustibacter luteus]|uniref:Glycosyltransferase n=1 Tax=Angustibacter luteus TaxID=658456 RepID=A0ABW1JFP1_9ACTN